MIGKLFPVSVMVPWMLCCADAKLDTAIKSSRTIFFICRDFWIKQKSTAPVAGVLKPMGDPCWRPFPRKFALYREKSFGEERAFLSEQKVQRQKILLQEKSYAGSEEYRNLPVSYGNGSRRNRRKKCAGGQQRYEPSSGSPVAAKALRVNQDRILQFPSTDYFRKREKPILPNIAFSKFQKKANCPNSHPKATSRTW